MNTQTPVASPQDVTELYDALMWEIEPELTTELIDDVEFLYEKETPEERQLRAEWYAIAFEQLHKRMEKLSADATGYLQGIKKQILSAAQKNMAQKDAQELKNITRSLSI